MRLPSADRSLTTANSDNLPLSCLQLTALLFQGLQQETLAGFWSAAVSGHGVLFSGCV